MRKPSAPSKVVEPKVEAKAAAKVEAKPDMPDVGAIVLYRLPNGDIAPLLVTRSNDTSFDGQCFHEGTQVTSVTNAVFGDEPGQCVPPAHTNHKEA